MVFSSLFFVLFFFVLCSCLLIAVRTTHRQNVVLLLFSLVFYAWGGPRLLLLLCAMTLICYLGARLIGALSDRYYRSLVLFMTLSICLLLLGFFKYAGFIATGVAALIGYTGAIPDIILPIGISFYTFQLMSYVIDVWRGEVPAQKKFWLLLLYASLFHQCVAGPIVRYSDVCAELEARSLTIPDISSGLSRFCVGLAKKAVLANTAGALATALLDPDALAVASSGTVFLGGTFYMLQIYLDFSAYSDMAVGMGRTAGLHYVENFRYPYTAASVTDFWRRWHISLSTFFRDYVYIPLGGNRCGIPRQIFNLLVVWALTGLWHGASWNYVLWGLYYFVFLVLEKFIFKPRNDAPLPLLILRRIGVLTVVWFGWLLFYYEDLHALRAALSALFCLGGNPFWDIYARNKLLGNIFFLLVAAIACTPIVPAVQKKLDTRAEQDRRIKRLCQILGIALPALLLLLSLVFLVGNTYNPFLYFQF